jgi:hypothetical protein
LIHCFHKNLFLSISISLETKAKTKLTPHDQNELKFAIEIFGLKTIGEALDKSPDVKKEACETIKGILSAYISNDFVKPGKMLKGTSQIATRLIRDKMWAIFLQGITVSNMMYTHFIFTHSASKKELGDSSLKIYKELLTRSCDANERVQDKAEDALESMVINEKIRNVGTLHEALLQPLQVRPY